MRPTEERRNKGIDQWGRGPPTSRTTAIYRVYLSSYTPKKGHNRAVVTEVKVSQNIDY